MLYNTNKPECKWFDIKVNKEIAPYALNSGKLVDDLGFPKTCLNSPSRAYFTGKLDAEGTESEYTVYLGICFTSKCNTQEMNDYGGKNE